MKKPHERAEKIASTRLNVEVTRIVAWICVLLVSTIAGIYLYFLGPEKLFEHFAHEVILAGLLFALAYFLLWRHGILIGEQYSMKSIVSSDYVKEFFVRHDDVDWATVIEKAAEIDIVVFYYGNWVRDHHDSFVTFFRNKGKLSLIVGDPDDPVLVKLIQTYFFPALNREDLPKKIKETQSALINALNETREEAARLQVFYFSGLLHYSFVLVDKHQLYLSVYEQFRGPRVRSSVFRIDLTANRDLKDYWLGNLERFKGDSRQPSPRGRSLV